MRVARVIFRIAMVAVIVAMSVLLAFRALGSSPEPPMFAQFTASKTSGCAQSNPAVVVVRWTATGAEQGWLGIDTDDARATPLGTVGAGVGNAKLEVPCPVVPARWTVTLEGPGGVTHSSIAVRPGDGIDTDTMIHLGELTPSAPAESAKEG